jgi:hypothetical protein
MANWHWILLVIVVYLVGVKFPSAGKAVLSKVGVSTS